MKYRPFGKLDWLISELSVGVLRLGELAADSSGVGRSARTDAVRRAIDGGCNYLNLGFPYYFPVPAEACAAVREMLADGYREKVRVALNIPSGSVLSCGDLDRALEEQCRWFGLDKADFCILDGINRSTWKKLKDIGAADWAARAVSSGKAGNMGLAYHDDAYFLQEIYGVYPDWALIQLELSALDYRHHPGVGGFRIIGDHGTAIVATDCTKAGRLLKNIPAEVLGILNDAGTARVPAEWYLSWALGNQEVSSVLLDLDTEARAAEYMAFAGSFTAGDAGVTESLQAARIRDAYNARRRVQCAACRCCMPCPLGIDAPRIIELYNDYLMFGDAAIPGLLYLLEGHARLDCIRCDRCRTSCPKHFPVPDILADMKSLSKS